MTRPLEMARNSTTVVRIETSWGPIPMTMRGERIVEIELPCLTTAPPVPFDLEEIRARSSAAVSARMLRHLECYLQALFGGRPVAPFAFVPPMGSRFSLQVWAAIQQIPLGQTRSYGDLARAIGTPKAARAVGRACGANPLPLLIPCHRVVAANGALGGFSCGLAWKQLLLQAEGIL